MEGIESVLLVLLLGTWAGGFWLYRQVRREIDTLARERGRQAEVQPTLGRLASELQEAADELAQATSARASRLRDLLAQADRRIAEVEAALACLREAQSAESQGGETQGAEMRGAPQFGQMADARTRGRGDNGAGARRAPAARPAARPEAGATPPTQGDRHAVSEYEEVRRLAAQGLGEAEIAQRTHRGREEVRLLLRLTKAA